jgi:hypothetical protein
MEREADEAAAEWILEGLDKEDPRFRKRAMGIALALGWLTSTALYVPEDQQYHPPSYERLASIIGRFVPDPNDLFGPLCQHFCEPISKLPESAMTRGAKRLRSRMTLNTVSVCSRATSRRGVASSFVRITRFLFGNLNGFPQSPKNDR